MGTKGAPFTHDQGQHGTPNASTTDKRRRYKGEGSGFKEVTLLCGIS